MSVLRFDPFRDFDRLAEQMFSAELRGTPRSVPMDAYRRGDKFLIHLDLPGVDPDAIELTVEQNVLTIRLSGVSNPRKVTRYSSANGRRALSRASSCSARASIPTASKPTTIRACSR
jgi:HSP20 family molecular chaperone IbpA